MRSGTLTFVLSLDQGSNATTIAAVAKRLGLPDHAVTVGLAAALQESQLRNLDYGDLDSRGLFQQRPSQGWGTAAQVMTPHYAAAAFFQHLAAVPNWPNLPVTVAAQQVQRSGSPAAYAQWETEARALAEALTGEVPHGLACHSPDPPRTTSTVSLADAMSVELGPPTLGTVLTPARGWTVAAWLVGHATQFGITSVGFGGSQWQASTGTWSAGGPADAQVHLARTTTPTS